MRTGVWLLTVLLAHSGEALAATDRAEDAYQAARRGYYALKDDPKRRKLRHNWLNVAQRFEQVARRFPTSARAPDALYTAADLLQELARFSRLDEDRAAAARNFELLVSGFPTHRLADDAALALARFELEQRGRPNRAREVLASALRNLPRGDRAAELRALLEKIPADDALKSSARRILARPGSSAAEAPTGEHPLAEAFARGARRDPGPQRQAVEPPLDAVVGGAGAEVAPRGAEVPAAGNGSGELAAAPESPAGPEAHAHPAPPAAASPTPSQPGSAAGSNVRPQAELAASTPPARATGQAAEPATAGGGKDPRRALQEAARIRDREVTIAQQLGLKVRRVVIDPGHGGHDSGAVGRRGTLEKDVSLSVSRKLAEILADAGFEVVLTRDEDTFVRLEDRARIANEFKGDLFISIHCNSAENRKLRGVETYTLNLTSDRYSMRLAARENSSSERGMSDLQFILADLATKANTEESSRLAARVQGALVAGLASRYQGVKDLGTKQALFYVLLGVRMPAILVETSFLSHPEEEKRLASGEYQAVIARSIADGIQDFLGARLARAPR